MNNIVVTNNEHEINIVRSINNVKTTSIILKNSKYIQCPICRTMNFSYKILQSINNDPNKICTICLDANPNIILENCKHDCVCDQCALLLVRIDENANINNNYGKILRVLFWGETFVLLMSVTTILTKNSLYSSYIGLIIFFLIFCYLIKKRNTFNLTWNYANIALLSLVIAYIIYWPVNMMYDFF